jgi:hypothetical protein
VQGLFFCKLRNLGYGLMQPEGGPCGALAVVQAYTLLHLLHLDAADHIGSDSWSNVR